MYFEEDFWNTFINTSPHIKFMISVETSETCHKRGEFSQNLIQYLPKYKFEVKSCESTAS